MSKSDEINNKYKATKKRHKDDTYFGSIDYLDENCIITKKHIALVFNTLIIDEKFNFCDYRRELYDEYGSIVSFKLCYLSLSRVDHPSSNYGIRITAYNRFHDLNDTKEINM